MKTCNSPSAERDIQNLDVASKAKVLAGIRYLRNFPEVAHVKKLKGSANEWRLRVGNHRIRFSVEGDTIFIERVLPRKDAYR